MILPGNNKLVLCQAALMAIVQEHINSKMYSRDSRVVVTHVTLNQAEHVAEFAISNPPEVPKVAT